MNDNSMREELDRILESCRTKEKWDNADRKVLLNFRKSLGPPTETAQALGISVATLHWWERQLDENELQPPPPEHRLRGLYQIIASKVSKPEAIEQPSERTTSNLFADVLMRMTDAKEILSRAKFCKRTWIMRSGRPFVILTDLDIRRALMDFLNTPSTNAYFVYRAPKSKKKLEPRFYQAKATFDALLEELKRTAKPSVLKRVHGVPVADDHDANKLGLVDPWNSISVAEYSYRGYAQYGKWVDVWLEFIYDASRNPQLPNKQVVWFELPADEAEKWMEARIPMLETLVGHKL